MTTTLPADLKQMREVARIQLRETLMQAIEVDRETSIRAWGDLIDYARETLPHRLMEYLDVKASHATYGPHEAWLIFRLPGCWPISTRFSRGIKWNWSPCGRDARAIDHPTRPAWYAVHQDADDPEWAQTTYCYHLGSALVVAEIQEKAS